MKPRLSLLLSLGCYTLAQGIYLKPTSAQVASDGTLPTPTEVTENGTVTEITGGTARGSNLFHSFQNFSVDAGGTADFLNDGSISTIFSRVTGGNPSNIDGLIRTNNASLFFLNPAGIIFGAGASLELGGGSFYGSTADSLLFEDGEFIATNTDNTPVLSINAPIGLGFRDDPADISVAGNENAVDLADFALLSVAENQSVNLIGGNVNLDSAILFAPSGEVELGGLSASGSVGINEDGSLNFPDNLALGNVSLDNSGVFTIFGEDGIGGSIDFSANNIDLLNGSILQIGIDANLGSDEVTSGDINLNATGSININFSSIENQTDNQVEITDGTIFSNVGAGAEGNGGTISINSDSLSLTQGGQIQASVLGSTDDNPDFGQGNAGDINLDVAGEVLISGVSDDEAQFLSGIFSSLGTGAVGDAGNINIEAGSLTLSDGARLDTVTFGQGNPGRITLSVDNAVTISGGADILNTVVSDAVTTEDNNSVVTINAGSLSLNGSGSSIDSSTFGQGNAGDINITADTQIELINEGSIFSKATLVI